MRDHIKTHYFAFNHADNGGECLSLKTHIYVQDGEIQTEQEFSLQSYFNSASFDLVGAQLTPDLLRKLANELESEMVVALAQAKIKEKQK